MQRNRLPGALCAILALLLSATVHANTIPFVDAGPDLVMFAGDMLTISGATATDPDGDTLLFGWSQDSGPPISFSGSSGSTLTPTVIASAAVIPGGYFVTLLLQVYDGTAIVSDQMMINILNPGDVPAVPVPAAIWLFSSGLLGLVAVARRRKRPVV